MGKRGYSGTLMSSVLDVTHDHDAAVLINYSDNWATVSAKEFNRGLDELLQLTSEEDEYVLWYNIDFVKFN